MDDHGKKIASAVSFIIIFFVKYMGDCMIHRWNSHDFSWHFASRFGEKKQFMIL